MFNKKLTLAELDVEYINKEERFDEEKKNKKSEEMRKRESERQRSQLDVSTISASITTRPHRPLTVVGVCALI